MFTFSLSGLEIKSSDNGPMEVEENETTSRSAVYMVLGKFFAPVNNDQYEAVLNDHLEKEIEEGASLLPFGFDTGHPKLAEGKSYDDYASEYVRLFRDDKGGRLLASYQASDPENVLAQIKRDYEYFGLGATADLRPLDHLATQCDFLQYLCFKEAATPSPRLKKSFQRAQRDFLQHYLIEWVPALALETEAKSPIEPFNWAIVSLKNFVASDYQYISQAIGG